MAYADLQQTANRRRSMTIRRRLTFSFVIILTLFGLNLVIFCLYGCFSKPLAVVWEGATAAVSKDVVRVSDEVCQ